MQKIVDKKENKYDIDIAWENFLYKGNIEDINISKKLTNDIPKGTDLYISTKTMIAFLSHPIPLFDTFWKIPIICYHIPEEGIIKKQMKFNSMNEDSLEIVLDKIKNLDNVNQYIINRIINPEGRIKFKDIRKISIGLCNKDIISYRSKKKSAFYNCFVIIIRILEKNIFKEVHVKIFNTGKLEIPGIRCNKLLIKIMDFLVDFLRPITKIDDLTYNLNNCETVLINSNFNCGFYINREKLLDILKYKYKINCMFDSCQYPGIQCKYYMDTTNIDTTNIDITNIDTINIDTTYKISFMIFRTGSVLIIGKCDEKILNIVYNFIKDLLIVEYPNIYVQHVDFTKNTQKTKKLKTIIIKLKAN
jgi:hypothetical protein